MTATFVSGQSAAEHNEAESWVLDHAVPDFKAENWTRYKRALPASLAEALAKVVADLADASRQRERPSITRRDVFGLFSQDPLKGMTAAIVWGYPRGGFPGGRSFAPVFERLDEVNEALERARRTRLPARDICDIFKPFKRLGPSTFTKLLYFAGIEAEEGPCLIYDQMVMRSIAISTEQCWRALGKQIGTIRKPNGKFRAFPPSLQIDTYGSFLSIARDQAGPNGNPAAIELQLFQQAPKGRSKRPIATR